MRGITTNIVFKTKGVPMVVPVKICNLQKSESSIFKQACPHCEGDVGRKNVCKECDKELQSSEILKAIHTSKTEKQVFTKEQVEKLKDFDDVITVLGTTQRDSIDFRKISGAFAILPDKKQKKKQIKIFTTAWKVIEQALAESNKALVVKFSTRQKERTGILISQDNVITLLQIIWHENFNEIDEVPEIDITDSEKQSGISMIDKLPEIKVEEIEDDYKQKVENLLESGESIEIAVSTDGTETTVENMFEQV